MFAIGARTPSHRLIAISAFAVAMSLGALTAAIAQGAPPGTPLGAPGAKPGAPAAPAAPAAKPNIHAGQIVGVWTSDDPKGLFPDMVGPAIFHIMSGNIMEIHPAKGNTVYGTWQILPAGLELKVPGTSKTPKAEVASGGRELKLDATVLTRGAKPVKKVATPPAGKPKAAPAGKMAPPVAAKPGVKPGAPPAGAMAPAGAAKPGPKPGGPGAPPKG